ncbi:hypothetical protein E2P81_ATG08194 [Venturia nashicola]|nr:hypothetical protein E2P81_ATG08194 [Venturia nashicola]
MGIHNGLQKLSLEKAIRKRCMLQAGRELERAWDFSSAITLLRTSKRRHELYLPGEMRAQRRHDQPSSAQTHIVFIFGGCRATTRRGPPFVQRNPDWLTAMQLQPSTPVPVHASSSVRWILLVVLSKMYSRQPMDKEGYGMYHFSASRISDCAAIAERLLARSIRTEKWNRLDEPKQLPKVALNRLH